MVGASSARPAVFPEPFRPGAARPYEDSNMRQIILSILLFLLTPCLALGQATLMESGTPAGNPAPGYEYQYIKTGMGVCTKLSSGIEICGGLPNAPSTQGGYFLGYRYTGVGTPVLATFQVGFSVRSVTGSSDPSGVVYSDCEGAQIQFTGSSAASETLPTPTTLNNPGCGFGILNATTGTLTAVTVTPDTWTINGGSTLTIAQNEYCWIYVDDTVATNWDAMCHATTQRP